MIKYALSNLAMLSPQTAYFASSPIQYWIKVAKDAGYHGLEWFPLRFPMGYGWDFLSNKDKENILSFHQSYLGEVNFKEAWKSKNPASIPSFLTLQKRYSSVDWIKAIQRHHFHDSIPVVVYETFEFSTFPQRIQITQKIVRDWKLKTPQQIIEWGENQNLRFVYDTGHSRNLETGYWQDVIPSLAPFIDEIHVRAGADLHNAGEIIEEIEDLYSFGISDSELAEILKFFHELQWQGLVVVEIPFGTLNQIAKSGKRLIPPSLFAGIHTQLLGNIQALLED